MELARVAASEEVERSGARRALKEPQRAGRYLVSEPIAHGGMASVHLAVVEELPALVYALKRVHPHLLHDDSFTQMLLDENAIGAAIQHPNVISTYGGEMVDGEMFVLMEYVAGASVADLLRASNGALPPAYAAAIMAGALRGLHAAHEAMDSRGQCLGVVHRDVSPQNIMVGIDGVARVFDFGIASAARRHQATRAGMLKGKLAYMAPEQVTQSSMDRRIDVYAAGIVLWEALTGQPLFQQDNDAATLVRVLNGEVPRPSVVARNVPWVFDAIVMRALAREPDRRYRTALEMAEALERVLALQPIAADELGAWVAELAELQLGRQEVMRVSLQGPMSARLTSRRMTPSMFDETAPTRLPPVPAAAPSFRIETAPARTATEVALLLVIVVLSGIGGALVMHFLHRGHF